MTAAVPKPASTLVLAREGENGRSGFEVLLVERTRESVFGAGALVFPGGIVEERDHSPAALACSPGLSPTQAGAIIEESGQDANALGFFLAAIRETFEETLVLLAGAHSQEGKGEHGIGIEELTAAREAMDEGSTEFYSWITGKALSLRTDSLLHFAHWITPEVSPHRYSTHFFLARAARDIPVVPDSSEIRSHRWLHPEAALKLYNDGEIQLMPPTVTNLELLDSFPSIEQAEKGLRKRPIQTVMPKIQTAPDGKWKVIYPWDPAYHTL